MRSSYRLEGRVRTGQQVVQQRTYRLQVGNDVHGRRRQRQRQRRIDGALRVLDHDHATGGVDRPRAGRAIGAGAGQDHRDQMLAELLGGGRSSRSIDGFGWRVPSEDGRMSWSVISMSRSARTTNTVPGAEPLVLGHGPHRQRAIAAEDFAEPTRAPRIEVLRDDQRGRKGLREASRPAWTTPRCRPPTSPPLPVARMTRCPGPSCLGRRVPRTPSAPGSAEARTMLVDSRFYG